MKEIKVCMLTILRELKLRSMGGKEEGKKKAQSVYPGQSLKIYSNLINQKSLRVPAITLVTAAVSKLKMNTNKQNNLK